MSLVDRVRRTIRRFQLAGAETRLVAAVSGGSDSVALLHLLRELDQAQELRLAGVAHLNHQLRSDADADERFCATLAEGLGLPFVSDRADVRALAGRDGRSLEDAAHVARHAFFERARVALAADAVAVGHTADDQAETFLLRLLRGAGSRGLGAMHPRSGSVVRPMLDCRRADLRAFVDTHHLPFVDDATNADTAIPRNRVRAELVPLLERRFNPAIVDVLARDAELARADDAYFDEAVAVWSAARVRRSGDGVEIDVRELTEAPLAIGRRALLRAMTSVGLQTMSFEHVDRAWSVVLGLAAASEAPGLRVERRGGLVVLRGRTGSGRRAVPERPVPAFKYSLPVPGEAQLPELGCALSAEVASAAAQEPQENGFTTLVSLDRIGAFPLAVRNRRPGDRLRPGRAGRRKLQDLLVDRKVPREHRDRIPIVVDADDRIVWVAGHALDEEFRVTDPAQAVVILRLKGGGGSF